MKIKLKLHRLNIILFSLFLNGDSFTANLCGYMMINDREVGLLHTIMHLCQTIIQQKGD